MDASTSQRYTARARWLHWSMAILIVLAYTLILSRTQFSKGSEYRLLVVQSHYWVGILILIMAFSVPPSVDVIVHPALHRRLKGRCASSQP